MEHNNVFIARPTSKPLRVLRPLAILLTVGMIAAQALPGVRAAQAAAFPDPAMESVWTRTDAHVQAGLVSRSWMWGPSTFYTGFEPYAEGVNGQHLVAYFDKSRMEINDPNGDRSQIWFVTNGLLVVEMMTGKIQTGNNSFLQIAPNNRPIAGDGGVNSATPSYARLAQFASLNGDHRAPNRVGQPVAEGLRNTGDVGQVNNLKDYASYGAYDETLGHNIPDVFWAFMNQKGPVSVGGRTVQDTVIDWTFAMGYPLTEPYWMPVQVGTEERWVLVQAFQRRILTYSPSNPPGFQVEMGNVGRSYYDWRYVQNPGPVVTPTPAPPGQAAITVSPTEGDSNTTITVSGVNFPPSSQVSIQVERADANYIKGIAVIRAGADGKFSYGFKLPSDAARFDSVTIAAIAGTGGARATAEFHLNFRPAIVVSPQNYIPNGGIMTVTGSGFPANVNVQIGIVFDGAAGPEYPTATQSDGNGAFRVSFGIGNRAVGSRFMVFATAAGGLKASYNDKVTVVNPPILQVSPTSGPVGVNVTLRGTNWPAGAQVTIGYRGAGDVSEGFLPSVIPVDGAGNFTIQVYVDPSLAGKPQVIFSATSNFGLRAEAIYQITSNPPPPPANPTIRVSPAALQPGQDGRVTGAGWTSGSVVTIALAGAGKQQTVATATADRAGNFSVAFHVDGSWSGAGLVQVVARSNDNRTATAPLVIITPGGGSVLENGLNMTVQTYQGVGTPYVKLSGAGWKAGLALTVSVISVGGDVNYGVATAKVDADGTWQAAFDNSGPWVGRADIGVRVSDPTGAYFSGRRLPVSTLVKIEGGNYTVVGANWGANTQVEAVLQVEGRDVQSLGNAAVDGNGNVSVNITVPRADGSRAVVFRTKDTGAQPIRYIAVFGIDARAGKFTGPIEGITAEAPLLAASGPAQSLPGMPRTGSGPDASWAIMLLAGLLAVTGGLAVRTYSQKRAG